MQTGEMSQPRVRIENLKYVRRFISIQGNIGSGKSTLLASIRRFVSKQDPLSTLQYILLDEPVALWMREVYNTGTFVENQTGTAPHNTSKLQLMYGDMRRYAYVFQHSAFISRYMAFVQALQNLDPTKSYILISERDLRTDRLFLKNIYESNQLMQVEWVSYNDFFEPLCGELVERGDTMFYVSTPVSKCDERIHRRKREGESDIPVEYLHSLERQHMAMLEEFRRDPQHQVHDVHFGQDMTDVEIDLLTERLMQLIT